MPMFGQDEDGIRAQFSPARIRRFAKRASGRQPNDSANRAEAALDHINHVSSPLEKLGAKIEYFDVRDRLATDIKRGDVGMEPAALVEHIRRNAAVDFNTAAIWAERFRADTARHLTAKLSKETGGSE